jgi:RHS repeat-associated protein
MKSRWTQLFTTLLEIKSPAANQLSPGAESGPAPRKDNCARQYRRSPAWSYRFHRWSFCRSDRDEHLPVAFIASGVTDFALKSVSWSKTWPAEGPYGYDAAEVCIAKVTESTTSHYYYSDQWQVLEERLDSGSGPVLNRQFVWGIRSIDDLILRDRDTTANGALNERFYALHDAMSVTAVVNTSGTVQERYGYDGFGSVRYMTSAFGSRASSDYAWKTLFGAYRYDEESGLYQVRYRYLHPGLGRWVSRDPLWEHGGTNLSSYVFNRPLSHLDRSGLYMQIPPVLVCPEIWNDPDFQTGLCRIKSAKKACEDGGGTWTHRWEDLGYGGDGRSGLLDCANDLYGTYIDLLEQGVAGGELEGVVTPVVILLNLIPHVALCTGIAYAFLFSYCDEQYCVYP